MYADATRHPAGKQIRRCAGHSSCVESLRFAPSFFLLSNFFVKRFLYFWRTFLQRNRKAPPLTETRSRLQAINRTGGRNLHRQAYTWSCEFTVSSFHGPTTAGTGGVRTTNKSQFNYTAVVAVDAVASEGGSTPSVDAERRSTSQTFSWRLAVSKIYMWFFASLAYRSHRFSTTKNHGVCTYKSARKAVIRRTGRLSHACILHGKEGISISPSSPEQQPPEGRKEEHREHGRARVRLRLAAVADASGLGTQRVMFKPAAGEVRAGSPLPLEQRLALHAEQSEISFAGPASLSRGGEIGTHYAAGGSPAGCGSLALYAKHFLRLFYNRRAADAAGVHLKQERTKSA